MVVPYRKKKRANFCCFHVVYDSAPVCFCFSARDVPSYGDAQEPISILIGTLLGLLLALHVVLSLSPLSTQFASKCSAALCCFVMAVQGKFLNRSISKAKIPSDLFFFFFLLIESLFFTLKLQVGSREHVSQDRIWPQKGVTGMQNPILFLQ